MSRRRQHLVTCSVLVVLALIEGPCATGQESASARVDRQASQTSTVRYTGYELESVYITMSDGVRLAADVFRPTREGEVDTEPLPLIWAHTRYIRGWFGNGERYDCMSSPMRGWVLEGYVVAAVDVRGSGASFGRYDTVLSPRETQDAAELLEWFVDQPWCDGNIGMFGGSYLGATQLMAATSGSRNLKAIIPSRAPADRYAFAYCGGIRRDAFLRLWRELTVRFDTDGDAAPVDADGDGLLRAAAARVHRNNRDTYQQCISLPFRNSFDEKLGIELYPATSPITYRDKISESGVAIYHLGGWFDMFTRDAFLLYRNLDNPQRLAMGPSFHAQKHRFDSSDERLRWYDHYLKGIDNGIDREPPIHYFTMGAPEGEEWRSTWKWPLPEEQRVKYYFHAQADDPSDGQLRRVTPELEPGKIDYSVDYTTSSGSFNRWSMVPDPSFRYADMKENDARGMCFTSAPLADDLEVTGHPVAHIWIRSTADDGDFFIYLEEVTDEGVSEYVTEGCLRASHRKVSIPPYEYLGLPYHRSNGEDVAALPDEPVLLQIDLQPTSVIVDSGHRIRVNITCADLGSMQTPILDPAPVVSLYCQPGRLSFIELPLIPASDDQD